MRVAVAVVVLLAFLLPLLASGCGSSGNGGGIGGIVKPPEGNPAPPEIGRAHV